MKDWPIHKAECGGMASPHTQIEMSDTIRLVLRLMSTRKHLEKEAKTVSFSVTIFLYCIVFDSIMPGLFNA